MARKRPKTLDQLLAECDRILAKLPENEKQSWELFAKAILQANDEQRKAEKNRNG